ncbi:MAG: TIGR04283 family arsenosugar biosynthesis glycosyltransferase [Pseudomonadota bacterium]
MAAPVSVIIPTYQAADRLGPCLAALAEGLGDGILRELIIVDCGSQDGIEALADAIGAEFMLAPRGRGRQLAAAARRARGSWFLFLHADTVLEPGWGTSVIEHVSKHPQKAGWFRLRFDTPGFWPWLVAGWANLRARHLGLPYGDQGLLIHRALYSAVGGYPEIALMEDVALVRALRGRLAPLSCAAVTSAARYRAEGWLRRGLRNQLVMLRYLFGVSPERLSALYEKGQSGG